MNAASQGLRDLVSRMIDEDDSLDAEVGLLVLAALDGAAEFAGGLGDERPPVPRDAAEDASPTAGSYLASITVEGFRGVGEAATLDLAPGPGLTVVAGRNGSGKSSFAEAAELAITGANLRWDGQRSVVWKDGWRNLHRPDPTRITVELAGDGPPLTLTRSWTPGEQLDGGTWTRQIRGERTTSIGAPGAAVVTYRPFLSYNELGSLVEGKPSEMYDALHTLLGLDDLTSAQRRIGAARKDRDDRAKAGREARKQLVDRTVSLDDERAVRATAILRAPRTDLDALGDLALGTDDDATAVALLRQVAALTLPAADTVERAALELDESREQLETVSSAQARASAGLAELLRTALAHHAEHGDGLCPVCGRGEMDATWRVDADRRAGEAEQGARDLATAGQRVEVARSALATLTVPPPAVLSASLPIDTAELLEVWTKWRGAVETAQGASPVMEADQELRTVLAATVAVAEAELSRRDEVWRPIALGLVDLHERLSRIESEREQLAVLKKAESWVKDALSVIRDTRMEPLGTRSQEIWKDLRQQSNVDLGPIRLEGSATRRRAAFDVTVDEVEGAALGVMSQGELHSLALSLFLPRATVDESPFRFVLVDDPVQAMDPAKVDGLVRVFASVARQRQVIVFSHDDRLAESVRRSQIPATVVEVVRRDRSRVELRASTDPVGRHLDDASALVASDHVPRDVLGELVATYCRSALEAAAHAAFRRARILRGDDRVEVEQRIEKAHTTHQVLTLAVFHDESRDADLFRRLRQAGPGAVNVLQACKQGAHRGYQGDLRGLITDTRDLCAWVGRQ